MMVCIVLSVTVVYASESSDSPQNGVEEICTPSQENTNDITDNENIKIETSKNPSTIRVENQETYSKSNITIRATVTDEKTHQNAGNGTIAYKVNGITVGYANVSDGYSYYTYDSSKLACKEHMISLTYSGNEVLDESSATAKLLISKRPVAMRVTNKTVYSYTNVTLTATLVDKINYQYLNGGMVAFKLNGITIGHAQIIDGKANLTYDVSNLSPKDYNLTVVYGSNRQYYQQNATGVLHIIKRASSMSVSNRVIYYGQNVTLVATVADKVDHSYVSSGVVLFKVNGVTIGKSNLTDGKAYYNYSSYRQLPKTINLSAVYSSTKYLESNRANATLLIQKLPVLVTANNVTAYTMRQASIQANITDRVNKKSLINGYLTVLLDSKPVCTFELRNKTPAYTIDTSNLTMGNHTIMLIYDEDTIHQSNNTTIALLVKQLPQLEVEPIITQPTKNTIRVRVTNDEASLKQYVTYILNGVEIANATVKNSTAEIVYDTSNMLSGVHNLTVTYHNTDNVTDVTANTTITVLAPETFTYDQIKKAAVGLRTKYESDNILDTIMVASTNMGVQDFLAMMIQTAANINANKGKSNVTYKQYHAPDGQNDTMHSGSLTIKEVLSIGNRTLTYMNRNGVAPLYANTSLGLMGYYNLIYTYTKILDVSPYNYLVGPVKVYNWDTIHPEDSQKRVIYISTDNIYSKSKDKAFVDEVIKLLNHSGYKAYSLGIGPNTHNVAMWDGSLPDNAVQLSIFGGSDAGVLYDISTRNYMRVKANRILFIAFNAKTAKNITDLAWLERAHDDNYSPSSFKGISNPDQYLLDHGYCYVNYYTAQDVVDALLEHINK